MFPQKADRHAFSVSLPRNHQNIRNRVLPPWSTLQRFAMTTVRALRPEYQKLSLAMGRLARKNDTAVANMYFLHQGPLGRLAREVLFSVGGRPKVAKSRSKAIAYVTPHLAGDLLGVALQDGDVRAVLRRHDIESNHVNGQWTGVSRARFEHLYQTLCDALHHNETAALGLWLRVAADLSKSGDLEFYDGLATAGIHALRNDVTTHDVPLPLNDAVQGLLTSSDFSTHVDSVIDGLTSVRARDPIPIRTVEFRTAQPKPDCVEVCIRELVAFLTQRDDDDDATSWFAKCQHLGGQWNAEFLSTDPADGTPYELTPSKRNIALIASKLLFPEDPPSETVEGLVHRYNTADDVSVMDRSSAYLPRFSETRKVREIVDVTRGPETLEIHLERGPPPIAVATYRSAVGISDSTAAAHVDAFFHNNVSPDRQAVLEGLWLHAILGDRALEDERLLTIEDRRRKEIGILAARIGNHDAGRWLPLMSERSNDAYDHMESLEKQKLRHTERIARAMRVWEYASSIVPVVRTPAAR